MNPECASPAVAVVDAPWAELQQRVRGAVVSPADPCYDQMRQGWNLRVDQHPALLVVAATAADVAEAVRYARAHDLGIAVQSTGHGTVRPAAADDLLIVTSRLSGVRVDVETHTAWVGAGAKWAAVLDHAQAVGLAPLLGSSPDVGVVGYTLGGGMGWLARKYGLAADHVHHFELVTVDGELLRASATENPDLFWALRGGGGGLGIVTGMEIQIFPVSTVYGGNLIYPAQLATEAFHRFREWIATAPDELTSSIALMNLPSLPIVPEPLRGQSVVFIRGCYCGAVEDGKALLQPWRDWRTPAFDLFHELPFGQVGTISNDPEDPLPGLSSGAWLRELSDAAIDTLVRFGHVERGPNTLLATEVRHAGGAISRVPPDSTAYSNRDASLSLQLIAITPTPEAYQHARHYIDDLQHTLRPALTGGVYLNFLEGEESQQRTRDGFSTATYHRLAQLKAKYDPDNRLRSGFAIPPAH